MATHSQTRRHTSKLRIGVSVAAALAAAMFGMAPAAHATTDPDPINHAYVACGSNGTQDRWTTRAEAVARARSWIGGPAYSQEACYTNQYGSYRTDCSGMVSMAWGLAGNGGNFWTGNLDQVTTPIPAAQLQPGDALLRHENNPAVDHVALFVGWADAAKTRPIVIQQTGSAHTTIEGEPTNFNWLLYTPVRYDRIVEDSVQSSASVVFNGNLYEFARGTDGTVKYWYGNGGPWSATQSLGSAVASDPVATVFNGTLYVFARGTDGNVKYWYANGGAWSAAQTLAGSAGSGPLTSTVFNGSIYVFGRAADGTVKYFFANGGAWSAAQSVSATAVNGPLASTVFNGTLYLFATGTDGTAKYWYANGGAWSATQTVSGSGGLANGLTSTVFNGNLYVFGRATDGSAKYWFGNGGPWSATQTVTGSGSIGGAVSSSVFNGNLYVFARGTDGTAKYWFGNGGPWSATQTVTNSNGLG
ncbi:hypothetical protein [Dactylosporangium sp. NPDC000521]|uniref:hypothetical protein n=1 Tax=Dactylosporangium sp. NPDC000521 TaxID=3363975 RepID=UPI0036CA956E